MSSLLVRYKRAGGFLQLVKLIEGFGKEKREKFLTILEQEDANWAGAVESKILSVDRIMGWNDIALQEIISRMHDKNMAAVLHGLPQEVRERVYGIVSEREKKRIQNAFEEINPGQGEISSSMVMLLEETRELIEKKYLKLEDVDPELAIPDDIEDHLMNGSYQARRQSGGQQPADQVKIHKMENGTVTLSESEFETLKRKVIDLSKENQILQKQNSELAAKLAKFVKAS